MIEEIKLLQTSFSALVDAYKTLRDAKDGKVAEEKLKPLQAEIEKLQVAILTSEIAAKRAEREREETLDKLRKFEKWDETRARYVPHFFRDGQMIYYLDSQPVVDKGASVCFCQPCMDNEQRVQQLTLEHEFGVLRLSCHHCKASFTVRPE